MGSNHIAICNQKEKNAKFIGFWANRIVNQIANRKILKTELVSINDNYSGDMWTLQYIISNPTFISGNQTGPKCFSTCLI